MVILLIVVAVFQIGYALLTPLIWSIPFSWGVLLSGISSALIAIVLAKILVNQEEILNKLDKQDDRQRKILTIEKKVCKKCNYRYDYDYSSCPQCGNKEE